MKDLKKMIKKILPYHYYRNVVIVFLSLFLIMIAVTLGLTYVEVEAVPYEQSNVYDYMYVDVEKIYDASSNYYIGTDNQYVYIYYNDMPSQDVVSSKILNGVPKKISDENLEKILPAFQKHFPQLNINSISEMKEYVGLYALDETRPHLQLFVIVSAFISLIPLSIAIIYLLVLFYRYKKISSTLLKIEKTHQIAEIQQQLMQPIRVFQSLRVALLKDYLVINRPIPYVIRYDDIQWLYLEKKTILFLFDKEINLVIHDTFFNSKKVLFMSTFFKKNRMDADDFIDYMSSICPGTLIGYTVTNRQTYHSRKRKNHNHT